ncbi:hypothetical protein MGYG_06198 [Nannizzia gypsea CBS 118893]|uniref:Uncharacterized protein n=1 Tax=Arthroderma gypseum (strain ATCC MYA-4604 / CBS 118893) TaxID=535722 RepID=E4V0R2_ARTGP|nr:hypothetical protein MGYG_06198 [Nannizzia gypsea CBS 118893]EFR03199.1 hypothetical protein MGYG_06198 [Nannizzia gypsea CBS 118893]
MGCGCRVVRLYVGFYGRAAAAQPLNKFSKSPYCGNLSICKPYSKQIHIKYCTTIWDGKTTVHHNLIPGRRDLRLENMCPEVTKQTAARILFTVPSRFHPASKKNDQRVSEITSETSAASSSLKQSAPLFRLSYLGALIHRPLDGVDRLTGNLREQRILSAKKPICMEPSQ